MPSPTFAAGVKRAARSLFNHALRPPIRAGRDLRRRQKRMPERLARRVCGGGKMLDTRWIAVGARMLAMLGFAWIAHDPSRSVGMAM